MQKSLYSKGCKLTTEQMAAIAQHMGSDLVVCLQQHAGEGVYVPPGWAHAVSNDQDVVKIAQEFCTPDQAAAALIMQSSVRFPFSTPKDYLYLPSKVLECVKRFYNHLRAAGSQAASIPSAAQQLVRQRRRAKKKVAKSAAAKATA